MFLDWFWNWIHPKKTEVHCVVNGCLELKAPGQTYVCVKHMRTN